MTPPLKSNENKEIHIFFLDLNNISVIIKGKLQFLVVKIHFITILFFFLIPNQT